MRNRETSLCRCPNNARLFMSSWRKEVTWPKKTSSGWNKTFLEHALVPCSSHQAAKHKAEKLYQGLSEMKGYLPKGWAPHMLLRDLLASIWAASPLCPATKQAKVFCFFPLFTPPLHQREFDKLPLSDCMFLGKSLPRLSIMAKDIGSSYFLAIRPGASLCEPQFPSVGNARNDYHCDGCRGPNR